MRFGNSLFINVAWISVIVLALFFLWAFVTRKKVLRRFADDHLIDDLTSSVHLRIRKIKIVLLCVGLFFLIFSLSRPQWGFHWEEVKRRGLDIVIAIDTSNSMLAEDVKPNRLERSKLAVKDLIKKLTGDRIGLIAFSGSAFLQCPLTVDYNGFMLSLDALTTDTIPHGSTSLASAIAEGIRSFKEGAKKYRVLVIITDGEDHTGGVMRLVEDAKKEGIKIFCVGIGTKEGELIPLTDKNGKKTFLKDMNGAVVKSRLDEKTLQEIALATGGSYVRATGAEFGLELIYEEKLSKMEKRELESKMSKQYEERYQWFLLVGLLLLGIEVALRERKTVS